MGSIPGLGRSPGEGNDNPLQYSCLENPMDRGAWWAAIHGVTRVGHDLATSPPPPKRNYNLWPRLFCLFLSWSRTSYIICRAQCQMKTQSPLFKNCWEFQDGDSRALDPGVGPFCVWVHRSVSDPWSWLALSELRQPHMDYTTLQN